MLKSLGSVSLVTAINTNTSFWRYFQTSWLIVKTRLKTRPDVYILGFRGHEMYWLTRILTYPKPLIFDEFINVQDWLTIENKKLRPDSFTAKIARLYVRSILKSATLILTDTLLDAQSSSQTYGIPLEKYRVIYVAADEQVFQPVEAKSLKTRPDFKVFFYGNLAPLHGIDRILAAARQLKDLPISFMLAGGRGRPAEIVKTKNFIKEQELTNVIYHEWVDFKQIPKIIGESSLFLGGPFGNTSQACRVITGKSFQALAMGVPTVIGKTDEKVGFEDKKNCLLVEQGSDQALTDAIRWAYENRHKLPEIGNSGRKLYEKQFSLPAQQQKLASVLNEATNSGQ